MEFITYLEFGELQCLLIKNTELQKYDGDDRSALLTNCGLGNYCSKALHKDHSRFIPILCQTLSEVHLTVESSERLGLIVFLEHIMQLDLNFSPEEKGWIGYIIKKWDKWKSANHQKPKKNQIADLLAQGREDLPVSTVVQQPINFDRSVIVNYDLESQMSKFRQEVQYQGAFVLTVGGNFTILEEYIIERIRQELKQKTERQNERFEIRLYQESIRTSADIKRKFFNQHKLLY